MAVSSRTYSPLAALGARIGNFTGGSSVTQATNRSTGVTINALSGAITTNTTSLAAAAQATFTVTNSAVFADDVVILTIASGTNGGNTKATITTVATGSFAITIANDNASGGTAETGAIVINFMIMKASVN